MKTNVRLIVTVALLLSTPYMFAHTSGFKKLDDWVEIWKTGELTINHRSYEISRLVDFSLNTGF